MESKAKKDFKETFYKYLNKSSLYLGVVKEKNQRFLYYLKIWLLMSRNSFQVVLVRKSFFAVFLFGKILRFSFFVAFLYFIVTGADSLAGYNINQTLFFFLSFTLVDSLSQFLFRDVYRFRNLVVTGDFDLILTKPFSSLFRVLLGGADAVDLITLPPILFALYYVGSGLSPTLVQAIIYLSLVFNALLIASALHIIVVALGIITLEIDHTIMIYRDLTSMGRFPVDIYKEPLRGVLTYFVPIGIMMSVPPKVLMGTLSGWGIIGSFAIGGLVFLVGLRFWNYALRKYTSASS